MSSSLLEKLQHEHGYYMVSREYHPHDSVLSLNGLSIGGDSFTVIAGPCSVESQEQITSCASIVSESGGHILRGGCFKPRTSPYSFQGLGDRGLILLRDAGKRFNLPVVTEALSPSDVEIVAEHSEIIQVGARNMQNFPLLKEVGLRKNLVLLKRGIGASIKELLQAAEYILLQGNPNVILCERGIRSFSDETRFTLDISAVPVIRKLSHLPIFVDPSHASGNREFVPALASAAKAAGAHGVMIEIHPDPEHALSDGPQALFFDQFQSLMSQFGLNTRTKAAA